MLMVEKEPVNLNHAVKDFIMNSPKISDFEILKSIGSGHFGFIYLAKENSSNAVYALKQVDKAKYTRNNNVEHLFVERDIMARATSQWLVKLQYSFYDSNACYFVMDFLPGGDLMQLLLRSNDCFDEKTARFYLAEACYAINTLHSLSYVHRDVKPENLFIDHSGHLCLGDFGSAAKLSADGKVSTKMVVGTPEYVSPEVLLSIEDATTLHSYGAECDWWSYGILAFEMIYGCTPFEDDSQMALFNKIMHYEKYFRYPETAESTGGEKPVVVSSELKQLISQLLTPPDKRIGYSQIKSHAFFNGINFEKLRSLRAPFVPQLAGEDDTKYFPHPTKIEKHQSPTKETEKSSADHSIMAGFNFIRSQTAKMFKTPSVPKKDRVSDSDSELMEFNRDCSNMMKRLKENDRMIVALRNEISQRVAIFEQVQLQRDMLERDLTKQMAENALLSRQVSLQRRELENLERAVRNQLTDVKRQLQVRSAMNSSNCSTPAHTQTDDKAEIDVDSLLEQLSTLREQVEVLKEEKSNLSSQLKRAESLVKEQTLKRQSSVRDLEGSCHRVKAAEAESRDVRRKFDDLRLEKSSLERKTGAEIASLKSEVSRLELELDNARERSNCVTGLRSKLADAETKALLLEQRLQRTMAKMEEKERMLWEKENPTPRYSMVSKDQPKTCSTLVGTSPSLEAPSGFKSKYESLQKEVGNLKLELSTAERNLSDSKAAESRLRNVLTDAEADLEASRQTCDWLRTEQGVNERDIKMELEVIKAELLSANEAASEAKANAEAERKSRDAITRQLGSVERQLSESESRNAKLEKDISDIAVQISRIEVLASRERKVLDKEREKRLAAERELMELRKSSTVGQKTEATLKTALSDNLDNARRRNDELTAELQTMNSAKISAECDLKSAISKIHELQSEVEELNRTLKESQERLDVSEELRSNLASKVDELQNDRENLQRRLDQSTSAHEIEKYRLETTVHQQKKLIDYIQQKPPTQTPSKHSSASLASENKAPVHKVKRSGSKRHEAVPLGNIKFHDTLDFPRQFSHQPLSESNQRESSPNLNSNSASTSLLALGPNRSTEF